MNALQEQAKKEVLEFLFNKYKELPDRTLSIHDLITKHGLDPIDFSLRLQTEGLIKDRLLIPKENQVRCRITIEGAKTVDSVW